MCFYISVLLYISLDNHHIMSSRLMDLKGSVCVSTTAIQEFRYLFRLLLAQQDI